MKRSISIILLLSFLSSSICGAHGQNKIQKSALGSSKGFSDDKSFKTSIKNPNSVPSKSGCSNMIKYTLLGGSVVATPILLYGYDYYKNEKLKSALERAKKTINHHYDKIMSPYVKLDEYDDAGWSYACENYLVEQMAKTKYLLKEAGKSYEDELLFPATLLRILNLDGVLQKLRKNNIDQVYICFDDDEDYDIYDNNVEFEISDNRLYESNNEIKKVNSKTNKLMAKYYIQKVDVSPFYDEILKMCKPAIDNNKFLRELLEKLIFIEFTITKDGTLYCRTAECQKFDGHSDGKKLKFDHKF